MKINIFLRKKIINPLIILLSGLVIPFQAFAESAGPEINILTAVDFVDGVSIVILHDQRGYETITPDMLDVEVYDNEDGLLTFTLEEINTFEEAINLGIDIGEEIFAQQGLKFVSLSAEDSDGNQTTVEVACFIIPQVSFGADQLALNEGQFDIPLFYTNTATVPSVVAVEFSGSASQKLMLDEGVYLSNFIYGEYNSNINTNTTNITIDIPGSADLNSDDKLIVRFLTEDNYDISNNDQFVAINTPETPNDELVISFTDKNTAPTVELVSFINDCAGLNKPSSASLQSATEYSSTSLGYCQKYRKVYSENLTDTVYIEADITDINNDSHKIEWIVEGIDEKDYLIGDKYLQFTPNDVETSVITVKVVVKEIGTADLFQTTDTIEIVLGDINLPILSSSADTDNDGISDSEEGYENDADEDGIPDYLDNLYDESNELPIGENNDPMKTELGLTLKVGLTKLSAEALAAGNASITTENLQSNGNNGSAISSTNYVDEDYATQVTPIIDFEISGFVAGESVSVVIPLPNDTSIPKDAVYRKYTVASGWKDFVSDADNSISSAPRNSNDACPDADDDASYTGGLTVGHECVRVMIEDGGPNDADNTINGTIIDPAVIAVSETTNSGTPIPTTTTVVTTTTFTEGKSGGSTGLFVLLLLPLMLVRKFKK